MARSKKATVEALAAPAPRATTHPSFDAYRTLWVYAPGIAAAGGQTGYVYVLKTDAQALIDAGQAVDPFTAEYLPPIGTPPPPPPPPVTISITAISAENPAVASASAGDVGKLVGKTSIKISGATGTNAASVNKTFTIGVRTTTSFALVELDNSAPLDFGGFPLTGTL